MNRLKPVSTIGVVVASLWLSACGGGSSSPLNPNTPVESGSMDTTSPVYIGNGYGDSFQEGVIRTTVGDNVLSPGGSTNLTINIVSGTKDLAASSVKIALNSPCLASGEASLSTTAGVALTNNELTSTSGEVTAIYKANGCVGRDIVSATATLQGIAKVATAAIDIESDTVMTLESLAPVPSRISLKGAGGKETAQVSFIVKGPTGAPVKDVEVEFELGSINGGKNIGDATLQTTKVSSDKSGKVTAVVNSGHVATALSVTAKASGTNISTTSSGLIISTGIPDQDSMSIAAVNTHPVGWDYSGEETQIVARLADAFNNPVADGTPVSFTTEGGSIESSCFTKDGACAVKWTSQNPLPVRNSLDNSIERRLCLVPNASYRLSGEELTKCELERAGRVTVLARTIGDESFVDLNNNGLYDFGIDTFVTRASYQNAIEDKKQKGALDSELTFERNGYLECEKNAPLSSSKRQSNSPPACDDLAAAYLDTNENNRHDSTEQFFSPGEESTYPAGNGIYNGFLCRDDDLNCTNKEKVFIRSQLLLTVTSREMMVEGNGNFPYLRRSVSLNGLPSSSQATSSVSQSETQLPTQASISFWLADENGHGAPEGTTITINTSGLKNANAILRNAGPLSASDDPLPVLIEVGASVSERPVGSLGITVTFPHSSGARTWTDVVYFN